MRDSYSWFQSPLLRGDNRNTSPFHLHLRRPLTNHSPVCVMVLLPLFYSPLLLGDTRNNPTPSPVTETESAFQPPLLGGDTRYPPASPHLRCCCVVSVPSSSGRQSER